LVNLCLRERNVQNFADRTKSSAGVNSEFLLVSRHQKRHRNTRVESFSHQPGRQSPCYAPPTKRDAHADTSDFCRLICRHSKHSSPRRFARCCYASEYRDATCSQSFPKTVNVFRAWCSLCENLVLRRRLYRGSRPRKLAQ
jgi:hypothetical protein